MSEAIEEIQRLTNEVERLEAIDTDRARHFVLLKEKAVAIEQQFNVMASERDRFNASVNRLAEIVGLSGKQCFAPEAVERQAKFELATLRGRVEDLEGKRFPIQGGPSIPWRMILPHEGQHQKNHGQTLERMAERGGLSPSEALCVLDGEGWRGSRWGDFTCAGRGDHPKEKAARDELERRRAAFEDETVTLQARLKAAEKETETVNMNWDADRQELEDALAGSVPLCVDEAEASREMLQIVHAILTCDEKTLPGGLCQCTKYISAQFEGLRAEVKRLQAKVQYAKDFGLEIGIVKSSDCPEGRLGAATIEGSELSRLEMGIADLIEAEQEIKRLKTAAVECDFHVLQCPVLKGEDLELLDPVDSIIEVAPGTDFGGGIVDEEGTVMKVGPDGEVKQIPFPDYTKFLSCPHRDCDYYEPDPPGCKRADEEEAKQEKNVQREQDALDEVDDKD